MATFASPSAQLSIIAAEALDDGFGESDVSDAQAAGATAGQTAALAAVSAFRTLEGLTLASSASALGAITYDGGDFACDVVGTAPADPDGMSWATIALENPDGSQITAEFGGLVNLLGEPGANVQIYVGICDRQDFLAADCSAILFGWDGAALASYRSKAEGVWDPERRSGNPSIGPGARGTWEYLATAGTNGKRIAGLTRPLSPTGAAVDSNTVDAPTSTNDITYLHGAGSDLHWVVGFSLRATEAVAVPSTLQVRHTVTGPDPASGLAVAPAVWGWIGGQSNAIGNGTGVPVTPLTGDYIQVSTTYTDWPAGDDHSAAAGILVDENQTIRRGVYENGAGGTTIQQHIDTYGPQGIAAMQSRGITPRWHLFDQGEADSKTQVDADAYAAKLDTYLDLVLAAFPGTRIYLPETLVQRPDFAFVGTVNAAKIAAAAARALVTYIDPTEPLGGDGLHRTSAGQIEIGGLVVDGEVAAASYDRGV